MKQKQEIHCHACDKWVQFEIDLELDGNHILNCPNCDHEHCRVVRKGVVTDIRWDQRNGPTFQVQYATSSASSTMTWIMTSNYFLVDRWTTSSST